LFSSCCTTTAGGLQRPAVAAEGPHEPIQTILLLLLQVDTGAMQVDYSALVWQQKVSMN
jgi:hypothetical protein